MKLLALVVAALVATASVDGATNRPGSCKDDKDCTADYTCVSVQTTREGVINVKQCLPTKKGTPVCTGIIPGLCPSFSTTWGAAFRQISSVCAYILPEGKNIKCLADPTNSTKGGVECLFVQNPANTSEQLGVIYGCVDFDGQRLLFDKKSKSDKIASSFNYSEIIEKSCVNPKNPQGSTFVCSSQGTCSPSSANSMSYSCKCNIGFQGKYCEKIVNNECYHDGVCGGGSCDLVKNECKDCPPGTMGNKCAQCDPSYDATKVCGGHGKCVASSGDSTLGADGSAASSGTSSSNSTSSSSGSSDSKTTKAPSKTTKAPSTTSDGSGSAMGPGSVTAPSLSRLLMSMATTNQCKCDEGWTDANCAVKVKAAASSNSSASTPAPSSAAVSVNGVAGSMVAVVSVTLAAVFSA
jgi:hypothetical protein